MSRAVGWRHSCPPAVRALQQLAVHSPLFLLRQSGPAAYTVQEAEYKPVQVRLGDPHRCSCREHQRTRDLCLHIIWVLLKKLRLKPFNALSYQLGLVGRELSALLEPRPDVARRAAPRQTINRTAPKAEHATVPKRTPHPEDHCPICLLTFRDADLPVVYCRHSCGNAVHARCMMHVARHQLDCKDVSTDRLLSCPLCRGPFCRESELAAAVKRRAVARTQNLSPVTSYDVTCVLCRVNPVVGNLYRCLQCPQVLMCPQCISSPDFLDFHSSHGYAIKKEKWKVVRPANWVLPQAKKRFVPAKPLTNGTTIEIETLKNKKCAFCDLDFKVSEEKVGRCKDLWLHMSCIDDWRADFRRGSPGGLPLLDLSCLPGPPEVRVVRLSLGTRPQECRGPDQPRAPRPPRPAPAPALSPLRVRARRNKKKKPHKTQTSVEIDSNKLPMSVSLGRALGAQVQPLMAILMSPRVRACSLDSDSGDESHSEGEDKAQAPVKTPLLSITSLELPELAPARCPPRQPVRRVRTSVRRSRPANTAQAQSQSPLQPLACAGLPLARP